MARVRTEAPPPPPDRFVALIGEYGPDHDVLYVLEDGGRLVCLIEWLVRYPLAELGDERFAMPGHGMYAGEPVTFERGDAGAVVAVAVGGVRFARRAVGGADGAGFRIEPRFSADELRERARAVTPPAPAQDARAADLVDLASLDCGIRFDIRYATTDNFMGMVFYEVPKAMLQRPAARALAEAHARLAPYGLGLLVYDAYRPWSVTKMFWDATPEHLRQFVADPARGSRHNRGCAVDVTLCRLDDGTPVPMPSGYDEFTPRAFPDYPGTTAEARWHRELRRRTMAAVGFEVYEWEWWHFDYRDWREYPVLNEPLR
jgi:D-alanyl-D-alanine dipeptidase